MFCVLTDGEYVHAGKVMDKNGLRDENEKSARYTDGNLWWEPMTDENAERARFPNFQFLGSGDDGIRLETFRDPEGHPAGMLDGCSRAFEKESLLTILLSECIKAGDWLPVKVDRRHSSMEEDGLLYYAGHGEYVLSRKAKGLLYAIFGKEA